MHNGLTARNLLFTSQLGGLVGSNQLVAAPVFWDRSPMGTGAPDSGGPVSREYVEGLVAWLPPSSM
jgi:hypothetical protein